MTTQTAVFRCVHCHASHSGSGRCDACGHDYESVAGVPLLVRDKAPIEAQIEVARAEGKASWYEIEQPEEFTGPYRHHLRKRRAYLDRVLGRFRQTRAGQTVTALDLGCGDGAHMRWLSQYTDRLFGSDYNLVRLERAALRRHGGTVFMADVTDYPVADNSFDLIFFNHVLEHIPQDAKALAEVRRILKPGGLLVLGVPNEGAAFWQLAYKLEPNVRRLTDHVNFYTDRTLSQKCAAAGLVVDHVEHLGWGVPHWNLDFIVRRWKIVDDTLEAIGRRIIPRQATSLYLLCSKA